MIFLSPNIRLGEGDVVVINGKGATATIAGPAYPEDEELDIIRSHPTRVGIGEYVEVKKAE